jgi:hypothetical protein
MVVADLLEPGFAGVKGLVPADGLELAFSAIPNPL